ncbi:GFA family protein [Oceaniglobus roseus]|uniref:GFA family protein n=1 Tax=Oceaniglobus roseus TaxID=1737570 RepID=UPI000C7F5E4E|nr:GFA family protein [Kandeliimicrobium roseum]
MNDPALGRCLCGAVSFRVSGAFEHFFLCHCGRCRKDSGSVHSANLFSSTATLEWQSGEDHVTTFGLPGSRHVKCFCARCGSALPYVQPDPAALVVPAGSLDGPIHLRPEAHICFASRAEWEDDLAALPRLDGLPGQNLPPD